MRRFVLGLFVVAPLCAISSGAAAQETSHPMYLIRQEFVRPAQMADYEAETRRWLAGIDHVRSRLSTSRSDAPGRWSSSAGSVPTPIDHSESYVVELRPDLSYSATDGRARPHASLPEIPLVSHDPRTRG